MYCIYVRIVCMYCMYVCKYDPTTAYDSAVPTFFTLQAAQGLILKPQ